jgi:hypothetical protein
MMSLAFSLALRQIVLFVWVTLSEQKWVTLAERRSHLRSIPKYGHKWRRRAAGTWRKG